MNYRHAFHAGGFADVIKHVVLVRILTYLQDKQASFRVIDTHAGAGLYDLTGEEARRGGEWLTGIARLMQARFSEGTAPLIKPYLDIVRAFNRPGDLEAYPGSPLIARALLRPQDRLTACEVEPKARKRLIDALRRDTQARVVDLDGWVALPAFVPPKERRGLLRETRLHDACNPGQPFAAAPGFIAREIVAAGAGMAVDDAKRGRLVVQVGENAHQHDMLDDVGKAAGVKGVTVVHGESSTLREAVSKAASGE